MLAGIIIDLPAFTIAELAGLVSIVGGIGAVIGAIFTLWLGTKFASIKSFEQLKAYVYSKIEELRIQKEEHEHRIIKLEEKCRFEHNKPHAK